MNDAGSRRNDPEVAERLLSPAQQPVALAVALVLAFDIALEGQRRAEQVYLDGVVDHQVGWNQWIDLVWIAVHACHRRTHGCQVCYSRHAGEILEQHASRHECIFRVILRGLSRRPARQRLNILLRDGFASGMPKHILQDNPDGER